MHTNKGLVGWPFTSEGAHATHEAFRPTLTHICQRDLPPYCNGLYLYVLLSRVSHVTWETNHAAPTSNCTTHAPKGVWNSSKSGGH